MLASKLAIGLKNCSRTMRAALTRKMRKAWALRLRKMGKCATRHACLKGRARITKLYGKLLPELHTSSHLIGAQQVLFVSSERALVHAAFQAWDSYKADDALDCFSFGFYEVEAVREADGEWRMAALNINFAGQLEASATVACVWRGVNGRFCEQFARPWRRHPGNSRRAWGSVKRLFCEVGRCWRVASPIGLMLNRHV